MKTTENTGKVVAVFPVDAKSDHDHQQQAKLIAARSGPYTQDRRSAQGVRLIQIDEGDRLRALRWLRQPRRD